MAGKLTYRGWLVQQSTDCFEATHPDYDRDHPLDLAVFAETLEEIAEAVDLWIAYSGEAA